MNRPTVYPKFAGRLGNCMFMTAACIGLAKRLGINWGIRKGYIERSFNAFQVDKFFPNLPAYNGPGGFRYQEHKDNSYCHIHDCGLDQCWFNYHPMSFHSGGSDIELNGFWQSWKYFEGAEEEVREAFPMHIYDEYKDYVSVHVRRGDYVQYSGSFPPVTKEYVSMALEKIGRQRKIIFVSDDTRWCIDTFGQWTNVEFSEGRNEFEDMCVMASCEHNIISNSTLAWWAAWLNPNPDKIVISPSHKRGNWFGMESGVKRDCIDLIPPSWHQIEFR